MFLCKPSTQTLNLTCAVLYFYCARLDGTIGELALYILIQKCCCLPLGIGGLMLNLLTSQILMIFFIRIKLFLTTVEVHLFCVHRMRQYCWANMKHKTTKERKREHMDFHYFFRQCRPNLNVIPWAMNILQYYGTTLEKSLVKNDCRTNSHQPLECDFWNRNETN